ncbi:MAG: type II secretion system F family protein [Candidatus Diapherotrites archaeon]
MRNFFQKTALLSALCAGFSLYFAFEYGLDFKIALALLLFSLFGIPGLRSFAQKFFEQQRVKKLQESTPDLLLLAALLPRRSGFAHIVHYLSESCGEEWAKEFEQAEKQLKAGESVEKSLKGISERNPDPVIERAIQLLVQGYQSGADLSEVFKEAADDILQTQGILRERQANMTVEKYTLLAAGGLIVPLVLGLLVGMVSGFPQDMGAELGVGLSAEARNALLNATLTAIPIYLFEYALLASYFVALQESDVSKAFLYALFLLPIAFACFYGVQGF